MKKSIVWTKTDPTGLEYCDFQFLVDGLTATGVAIATQPFPYRLDYHLTTGERFATTSLVVESRGENWYRHLELRRSESGIWNATYKDVEGKTVFNSDLDQKLLSDALDCDLGLSPVTNTMPVLRHNLLNVKKTKHLCMVWVSVPELSISRSEQTYTFIARSDEQTVVQYASENGYTVDITFDTDGTVIDYPGLATRI